MAKKNDDKKNEKKTVQELKQKISESKNEKDIKKYYTKLVLAEERARIQKQQKTEMEENDEGSRTT